MRLESTKLAMPILPISILAYAWMADKHVHIAGLVVALFFAGLSSMRVAEISLLHLQLIDLADGYTRVHWRIL